MIPHPDSMSISYVLCQFESSKNKSICVLENWLYWQQIYETDIYRVAFQKSKHGALVLDHDHALLAATVLGLVRRKNRLLSAWSHT